MTPDERDVAWALYCTVFVGWVPPVLVVQAGENAALLLGAHHRAEGAPPLSRSALVAAVEAMLSDEPAPLSPTDATEARIEAEAGAYAAGRDEELDELERWWNGPDGLPENLLVWLAARRASAPKRGMTAAQVLDRIELEGGVR